MDNSGTDNTDLPKSILSGDDGTPKIISSADIAPATEDEHRATASRYASSSRSRFNRRQESANSFAASARLAADPNTPDFFKDAVMNDAIQPAANSRAARSASLSSAKPRKSHKGLIFAVVAVLVLGAGCVGAWYLLRNNTSGGGDTADNAELREKYNKFVTLLKTGEDGETANYVSGSDVEDGEPIHVLSVFSGTSLSYSDKALDNEALAKLRLSYESLKEGVAANSETEGYFSQYDVLMSLLDKTINYQKYVQEFISVYNSGQEPAAREYFLKEFNFDMPDEPDQYAPTKLTISNFYDARFYEHILYAKKNCYLDNSIYSLDCLIAKSGNDATEALNAGDVAESAFYDLTSEKFIQRFSSDILKLTAEIGGIL